VVQIRESRTILSAVDRTSSTLKNIGRGYSGLNAQLKGVGSSLRAIGQVHMMDFANYSKQAFTGLIRPAIDFSDAMSNVFKNFDETTYEKLGKTKQQINDVALEMSRKMGKSASDVAKGFELFSNANTFSDMQKMAEFSLKIGTAWNLASEEAGNGLQTLYIYTGKNVKETQRLADTINLLSNKNVDSAKNILEVTKNTMGFAKTAGLANNDLIALNATMTQLKIQPDVATTTIKNMLGAIAKAPQATKNMQSALDAIKYDGVQLAKDFDKDKMGTLFDLMDRFNSLPSHQRSLMLRNFAGEESLTGIASIVSNMDLLATNVKRTRDETMSLNAVQDEYNLKMKEPAQKITQLGDRWEALKISLGRGMLPIVSDIADKLSVIVNKVSDWALANPQLATSLVSITGGALALGAALGTIGFIGGNASIALSMLGGLFKKTGGNAFVASKGFNAVSKASGGLKTNLLWLKRNGQTPYLQHLGRMRGLQTTAGKTLGVMKTIGKLGLIAGGAYIGGEFLLNNKKFMAGIGESGLGGGISELGVKFTDLGDGIISVTNSLTKLFGSDGEYTNSAKVLGDTINLFIIKPLGLAVDAAKGLVGALSVGAKIIDGQSPSDAWQNTINEMNPDYYQGDKKMEIVNGLPIYKKNEKQQMDDLVSVLKATPMSQPITVNVNNVNGKTDVSVKQGGSNLPTKTNINNKTQSKHEMPTGNQTKYFKDSLNIMW
jgi:TP901 family phage tail tape measure protein